jgi:Putative peptidoglycan binding domain
VPRHIAGDDEKPRRRRGTRAAAIEAEPERGLPMRIFLHSPKDVIAGVLAFAAVSAIIANALFLQAGRHPSPMFGSVVTMPAPGLAAVSPLPRPRPVDADASLAEAKPVEKAAEPKAADPLANLVKATSAPPAAPANVLRPPAPIPAMSRADAASGARRVAAVQRTLTEYGYGQLKPTGTVGSDTQAAIQKFERERKLPVTGQMSDRLVRELSAMIGHPID